MTIVFGVANATRKSHNIHIVKKIAFNFVLGKNFESVVIGKNVQHGISALYGSSGLM
jgi:hypothetical protein